MDDLISKQQLRLMNAEECAGHTIEYAMGWKACIEWIKTLPSAQPERKTGRWEFQGDRMYLCTCCCYLASQEQLKSWKSKTTDSNFPPYCPNCGAKMEENGNEN